MVGLNWVVVVIALAISLALIPLKFITYDGGSRTYWGSIVKNLVMGADIFKDFVIVYFIIYVLLYRI